MSRLQGKRAAEAGKSFRDCPHEQGTDDYNAWLDGWWTTIQEMAKREIAKQRKEALDD